MNDDFIGFCMHCGKIVGGAPGHLLTPSGRLVCNASCRDKLLIQEQGLEQIRNKTIKQNRLAGYFSYVLGVVFLLFGIPHLFLHNPLFWLGLFLCPAGIVFLITGYAYAKLGKGK